MIYATIMAARGEPVVRRTPNYQQRKWLDARIERECKACKLPGPYIVEEYEDGKRIRSYTRG